MEQTIAEFVKQTFDEFGPSIAETLAQSFVLKFGPTHPDAIAAQKAIDRLTEAKPSPSQVLADLLANAAVVIPNARSSGDTRVRGRSVD